MNEQPQSRPVPTTVCISSLPLATGGGVAREVELLADHYQRQGSDVHIISPSNIRKDLFYNEEFEPYSRESLQNYRTKRVYFPLHFASAIAYGLAFRKELPKADLNLAIGSTILEATPFLFARKDFACLVATTYWDEWKSVSRLGDLSRPLSWMVD